MERSPPSSQQTWVRPSLGSTSIGDLFDQIAKGLDKYNETQKLAGNNRFSNPSTSARDTAAAKTSEARPDATFALSSASKLKGAGRPVLFGSQLMPRSSVSGLTPSYGTLHPLQVTKPTPQPLKFDPPSFVFGESNSTQNSISIAKTVRPKVRENEDLNVIEGTNDKKETSSNARTDEQMSSTVPLPPANGIEGSGAGSRKTGSRGSENELPSSSPQDHPDKNFTASRKRRLLSFQEDYACAVTHSGVPKYSVCAYALPSFRSNVYSEKDVDDFVNFANKWIPDAKKRRLGDKELE